jgi:hypothetical protein
MKSRRGGFSTGRIVAATKAASRLERPKKRGSTSGALAGVRTFATSMTEERQRSPDRRAASTVGYFWTSSAAVFRYWAAPADRRKSRRRNSNSERCPRGTQRRLRSKSARATRKSAIAEWS